MTNASRKARAKQVNVYGSRYVMRSAADARARKAIDSCAPQYSTRRDIRNRIVETMYSLIEFHFVCTYLTEIEHLSQNPALCTYANNS